MPRRRAVATGLRRQAPPSAWLDGAVWQKTACEWRRSWKPLMVRSISRRRRHPVGHQAFVPCSRAETSYPSASCFHFLASALAMLNAFSNASSVAKWRRQRPERLRSSKCAKRLRESARHFTTIVGQSVDMLQDTRSDRYPIARRLNTVPRRGGHRGLRPRRGPPETLLKASRAIGTNHTQEWFPREANPPLARPTQSKAKPAPRLRTRAPDTRFAVAIAERPLPAVRRGDTGDPAHRQKSLNRSGDSSV